MDVKRHRFPDKATIGSSWASTTCFAVDETCLFFATPAFALTSPLTAALSAALFAEIPSDRPAPDRILVLVVSVFSLWIFIDTGGLSPNRWADGSISHPLRSSPKMAPDNPISTDLDQSSEVTI